MANEMDYNTRAGLISALANKMGTDVNPDDLHIETSNYLIERNALDCTALGLDMESLEKTKNVIEMHEKKLLNSPNKEAAQYLLHLRVAKKCVEEIIAQKMKNQKK